MRAADHAGNSPHAGALLIHAWPDRVAKARGAHGHFVMVNGRGGVLAPEERLAGSAFLVVADLQGRAQNARIASAAAIDEEEIVAALGHLIEEVTETRFDRGAGTLRQRRVRRLGALVLAEKVLPPPSGAAADRAVIDAVRAHGLSLLPWDKEAKALRGKLAWLHAAKGDPWPDMSDEALLEGLDDWLLPFLTGEASLSRLAPHILREGLTALVPHEFQRRIGKMAPSHYDAPSGSHVPIRYEAEGPVLAIRVQELFGLTEHPTVADGIPLKLELLSPAHRPIQTTRDLPGFWAGSWADVRADMRGRYPKHVWPEDPANAAATHRAKPRQKIVLGVRADFPHNPAMLEDIRAHDPNHGLRLNTLIKLRWLAIIGQSAAVIVVAFGLDFPLPVGLCFALIAASAWLNVHLAIRYSAAHPPRAAGGTWHSHIRCVSACRPALHDGRPHQPVLAFDDGARGDLGHIAAAALDRASGLSGGGADNGARRVPPSASLVPGHGTGDAADLHYRRVDRRGVEHRVYRGLRLPGGEGGAASGQRSRRHRTGAAA